MTNVEIIKYPLSTEKALRLMESENKMVFVVERTAKKQEIKDALSKLFNVEVVAIRTLIARDGKKRAYVQFSDDKPAIDIATDLGMM